MTKQTNNSGGTDLCPPSTRASAASRVILSLGVTIALIIAAAAIAFHYIAVQVPTDIAHNTKEETFAAANRVASGFKSVFNFTPQVTVNGTTVIEQAKSVSELATVQQDVVTHYSWSQTWLGSTKAMELQGIYKAKAGFDLRDTFRVSVESTQITANLPVPRLLSLEMTGYKVLKDDSGWWNVITPAERENAMAAMQAEAKTKAAQSGLLEEAKTKFRQELGNAMKSQNLATPVKINFQGEVPGTPPPEM